MLELKKDVSISCKIYNLYFDEAGVESGKQIKYKKYSIYYILFIVLSYLVLASILNNAYQKWKQLKHRQIIPGHDIMDAVSTAIQQSNNSNMWEQLGPLLKKPSNDVFWLYVDDDTRKWAFDMLNI